MREKLCKACRIAFTPRLPMQKVCGLECAKTFAISVRGKAVKTAAVRERKADRLKLEALKTRVQWAKEAQTVVNRYVRMRDRHLGCISCPRLASWDGQWHGSHFRSVGAAPGLRFHLWNIHKACSICNNHLSGNIAGYAPRLVEKIGADKVEWLRNQNEAARRDADYFKRIKAIFSEKTRRMEKRYAV